MSRFVNIKGSLIDIDVFGQIQPALIEADEKKYQIMFYDKSLTYRLMFSFEDPKEAEEAYGKISSMLEIKIETPRIWL